MKRRILISILAAVTAVSVLSGCQAPKVNEGKKKDEIILAVTQSLDNLDPHKAEGAGTKEILFNIYEGLVKYNSKGELKDAVAEEHTISDDAKVYTFKIRKGIKFHNGKELTCGDVKYSLERASGLASGTPLVEGLSVIEKIDIDGDNVIITLKNSDSEFIAYLTTAIIPENISDSELEKTPVGTGPFKFVEYAPQQKFVVEKNNDYYGSQAKINKVTFKIVADMDSAFLELKAGNIDIFPYLTNDKTEQLGDNYQILDGNMNMVQLLGLNNSRKPYDDVRVRKAMNLAIDTKEIIDLVAYGYGTQIGGGMMPAYKKYYVEGLSDKYNKNIEEAKKLLKEAGYENGFETTITVPSNYIFHVQTAQVIVNQLKEIGVKATIKQVEWGVWLEQVYSGRDFDTTIIGLTFDQLTPKEILGRYGSAASNNFINFKSAAYDEMLKKAVNEIDDSKKTEYYKELQKILSEEAASVFIMDPMSLVAVKKELKGYEIYPMYVQDMSLVYFEE